MSSAVNRTGPAVALFGPPPGTLNVDESAHPRTRSGLTDATAPGAEVGPPVGPGVRAGEDCGVVVQPPRTDSRSTAAVARVALRTGGAAHQETGKATSKTSSVSAAAGKSVQYVSRGARAMLRPLAETHFSIDS